MSVSLLERQGVFGATSLSQMTRGNKVPNGPSQNAGVPASLPLSLSQLNGAVAYVPMSVSANNVSDSVDNSISNYSFGPSTATVTGGNPSKTYSWTNVSGTAFSISSPTSASTNFVHLGHAPAGTYSGTFKCTVNDGTASVDSNTITVTLMRT